MPDCKPLLRLAALTVLLAGCAAATQSQPGRPGAARSAAGRTTPRPSPPPGESRATPSESATAGVDRSAWPARLDLLGFLPREGVTVQFGADPDGSGQPRQSGHQPDPPAASLLVRTPAGCRAPEVGAYGLSFLSTSEVDGRTVGSTTPEATGPLTVDLPEAGLQEPGATATLSVPLGGQRLETLARAVLLGQRQAAWASIRLLDAAGEPLVDAGGKPLTTLVPVKAERR